MVRLFVKSDKKILNIVQKGIDKNNGNLLKFSKEVNICRTTIYHWFEGRCWIDIRKFKKICEYLKLDYKRFIINKKVHSSRSNPEVFNENWFKLNSNVALLLGWICTEGYIPNKNSCRITIAQNYRPLLLTLKKIILSEYKTKNKIIIRKYNDENKNTLEISSPMFWYILVHHFKISEGKKNFSVSVPKQIFNSSDECKLAFLASSFEGDGSWPPRTLTIRMTSERYIKDCKILFDSLKFKSNVAPLSQENTWILQICGRREIALIINKFLPYLFQSKKFNHFLKKDYFRETYYENMFLPFENEIIKKVKEKFGYTYKELCHDIFKISGYKISIKYLQSMANRGYTKGFSNIRMPMLVAISKILKDDSVIPKEFKWILYALEKQSLRYIKETIQNGISAIKIKQ